MIPSVAPTYPSHLLSENILPGSAMVDRLQQMLLLKPDAGSAILGKADPGADMTSEEIEIMRQQIQNYSRLCHTLFGIQIPQPWHSVAQLPIDKDGSLSCSGGLPRTQVSEGHAKHCNSCPEIVKKTLRCDNSASPGTVGQLNFLLAMENQLFSNCNASRCCSADSVASSGVPFRLSQSCNKRPLEEVNRQRFEESCTPRPRWCPTPEQIQILEALFNSGTTTPSRDMIVEIANRLKQYGNIAEANVFYWFQNRKARAKRKLQLPTGDGTVVEECRSRSRRVSNKTTVGASPRTDISQKTTEMIKPIQELTSKALQRDLHPPRQQLVASIGRPVSDVRSNHKAAAKSVPCIRQHPGANIPCTTFSEQTWCPQWPTYPVAEQQQARHLVCSAVDPEKNVQPEQTPPMPLSSVDEILSFSQDFSTTQPQQLAPNTVEDAVRYSPQTLADILGYAPQNFLPAQTALNASSTNKLSEESSCYAQGNLQAAQTHQISNNRVEERVCYPEQNLSDCRYKRNWVEALKELSEPPSGEQEQKHVPSPLVTVRNVNLQSPQQQLLGQGVQHQLLENGEQYELATNLDVLLAATKNCLSSVNMVPESKGSNQLVSQTQPAQDCFEVASTPLPTIPSVSCAAADSLVVSLPIVPDCEGALWEVLAPYATWDSVTR